MRLHYLQHVSFESPGYILNWANDNNVEVSQTFFFEDTYQLPDQSDFDCLVVMGGPMGVYDNVEYPWIDDEKSFIQEAISLNKPILGICLGAQLIASALGAKVYKGTKEIGWFPVEKQNSGVYFENFSDRQTVLHWHGDTFDLPEGATLLASNGVTKNQAFEINNVVGLQFHFEMGPANIAEILKNAANDLTDDPYVQTAEKISSEKKFY
ncbi:MAG: type 1 glutamine amidotransferase, partial [Pseudomonadota bacterium]